MSEVGLDDRTYARVMLASRILDIAPDDLVEQAVDEFVERHREELAAAHRTEATILFGSNPA